MALLCSWRLLTVLVRDGALCVSDSLLRRLDDAVGRVAWPAHDDRSLGCGGHGEGGEERNEEGGQDKAHVCRGVRVRWASTGVLFDDGWWRLWLRLVRLV
jgi:hypothetical protein